MAAIVRQRLLRTGDLEFTATTASDVDQYLVVVDERISKVEMAELWVATPGNPIPRATLKQLGSNYMICDSISCNQREHQGYIWKVDVSWKELDDDQPEQQSTPTPNNGSTDPNDWTPTWQRRTVVIFEPAKRAEYLSGYSATTEGYIGNMVDADSKLPIINSAFQEVLEKPEKRRRMYVWTFRWLRPTAPSALIAAEGKKNSADFTISVGGSEFEWLEGTALIDSVNLSKMRWGNTNLVEITVEVLHDPIGWEWEILDQGTARRRQPTTTVDLYVQKPIAETILDKHNRALQNPVPLDGNGQPLQEEEPFVYSRWNDIASTAFNAVPLLEDLEAVP